jgi:hypothetical protein
MTLPLVISLWLFEASRFRKTIAILEINENILVTLEYTLKFVLLRGQIFGTYRPFLSLLQVASA